MKTPTTFLSLAVLIASGCAAPFDSDDRCAGGKCDDLEKPDSEVEDTPCDGIILDLSGRGHGKVAGRLTDPLSTHAFRSGDSCPTSFQDIMAKLRETDANQCDPADPRAGIVTRVVSETAQILDTPTNYRLVTSRQCDERPTHGLLFSLFGVDANATTLPSNVEIIAFDEAQGVFNFYEAERDGTLKFFGNSKDMLKGPADEVRRCAGCHNSGGLVMKELDTPWLHWEGHTDTPGASELVERFENLGTKSDGREFEKVVLSANASWNVTRVKHVTETQTTREVLRPLFCTMEVNMDTGADFASPPDGTTEGSPMRLIPGQSLLSTVLNPGNDLSFPPTPSGIQIDSAQYELVIKANGQRVPQIPGAVDTLFDYPFVTIAAIERHYRTLLQVEGVVDFELVKDILMVDYTRPVFSEDRCGLLEFVPNLPVEELTAENVRKGLIQNLLGAADGSPAAELLANLTNTEADHLKTVEEFVKVCEARINEDHVLGAGTAEEVTVSAGLFDMVALNSLNRRSASALQVFEFPQTMPIDDLNVAPGSRLNPTDCTITTEFVAIAVAGELPPPEPEPGASCAHDLCEAGDVLDPNCDSCAAAICDADSFCCGTEWDSLCVNQVASVCGQTCE